MGVMLSAAGSLRWLRDAVAAGERYDALTRKRRAGRPVGTVFCSCPTWPASGRLTRTRTRAAPSSGSSCATIAARYVRAVLEVSPTGCATRLT